MTKVLRLPERMVPEKKVFDRRVGWLGWIVGDEFKAATVSFIRNACRASERAP